MLLLSISFPDRRNKFLDYYYYYYFCAYVSKCKFDSKYCGSLTEDRLLVGGEPSKSLACQSSLLRSLEIFQRIDFVKKKKKFHAGTRCLVIVFQLFHCIHADLSLYFEMMPNTSCCRDT